MYTVKNWAAWAPGIHSREDWLAWSTAPFAPNGNDRIKPTSIPPQLKRRCSHLTKVALEVSNQAMDTHTIDYAVFCSQHGELQCTVELLKDLASHTLLSPTHFSQSVHNTAAGLFSVMHKLHHNITSLAAGDNTFKMGLIDACTWLQLHPTDTVLLAMFDEYIPEIYQQNNFEYAVAFLLTNGPDKFTLDSRRSLPSSSIGGGNDNKKIPPALSFLARWIAP
jgi:hypothetical protein